MSLLLVFSQNVNDDRPQLLDLWSVGRIQCLFEAYKDARLVT